MGYFDEDERFERATHANKSGRLKGVAGGMVTIVLTLIGILVLAASFFWMAFNSMRVPRCSTDHNGHSLRLACSERTMRGGGSGRRPHARPVNALRG